jgi:hypothetical protein
MRSSASLATTAGALVALVAVAALVAGPVARGVPMEGRTAPRETTTSVRAVAAAVVAAARELVGKDRLTIDISARHALAGSMMMAPPVALVSQSDDQPILPLRTIGERLLDLPPPGC